MLILGRGPADGEGRERHRDRRDERVVRRRPEAAAQHTSVRPGLPSLKMIDAGCPAAWALRTFTPKLHVAALDQGDRPGTKPLKSAAVQPLAELGLAVGGMTMPPAGWRSRSRRPVLCPGFHSSASAKSEGSARLR